jgi:hypothetical protein
MNSSFPVRLETQQDIVAAIADNQVVVGTAAALGAAAVVWYLVTSDNSQIKKIRGWPLVGQWAFFTK